MRLSPDLERRWPTQNRKVEGLVQLANRYGGVVRAPADEKDKVNEDKMRQVYQQEQPPRGMKDPEVLFTTPYRITGTTIALRGIMLEPGQAEPLTLTFNSNKKDRNSYEVNVVQHTEGKVVGGILYIVRTGRWNDDK